MQAIENSSPPSGELRFEDHAPYLNRLERLDLYAACAGSVGSPASCQAVHPPLSATARFQPALLSSCATRALVASLCQAQKATSQASLGS